ncbi:hypothetical protein OSTOST_00479 [Ostertagia ostertagi]
MIPILPEFDFFRGQVSLYEAVNRRSFAISTQLCLSEGGLKHQISVFASSLLVAVSNCCELQDELFNGTASEIRRGQDDENDESVSESKRGNTTWENKFE